MVNKSDTEKSFKQRGRGRGRGLSDRGRGRGSNNLIQVYFITILSFLMKQTSMI